MRASVESPLLKLRLKWKLATFTTVYDRSFSFVIVVNRRDETEVAYFDFAVEGEENIGRLSQLELEKKLLSSDSLKLNRSTSG